MTTLQLKAQIENITFIAACQAMQAASAKLGNEKMIGIIHGLKMASLNA
jgi:hypothetical protein